MFLEVFSSIGGSLLKFQETGQMKKIVSLIFLTLSVFLFPTDLHSACVKEMPAPVKCAIPKIDDAFERAEAVFVGRVLNQKTEGGVKVFEFEVEKYWKGVEGKKIKIYVYETPRFQAQFEKGESYLIFAEADEESGKLFDRRCSRTKSMKNDFGDLKDDLEKLGEAKTCIGLGSK